MKKYHQVKALVLGIGVAVSGAAYPFSGNSQFGSGGGGSLVAQNTGETGYGFTRDVMCYPSGYFYNSPAVGIGNIHDDDWPNDVQFTPAVTFQVNVYSDSCNYIGIAEQKNAHSYPSYGGMHSWNTGVFIEGGGGYSAAGAWELPKGKWVEIIYLPYSEDNFSVSIGQSFTVGVACGATYEEAENNAQMVADGNADSCQ